MNKLLYPIDARTFLKKPSQLTCHEIAKEILTSPWERWSDDVLWSPIWPLLLPKLSVDWSNEISICSVHHEQSRMVSLIDEESKSSSEQNISLLEPGIREGCCAFIRHQFQQLVQFFKEQSHILEKYSSFLQLQQQNPDLSVTVEKDLEQRFLLPRFYIVCNLLHYELFRLRGYSTFKSCFIPKPVHTACWIQEWAREVNVIWHWIRSEKEGIWIKQMLPSFLEIIGVLQQDVA